MRIFHYIIAFFIIIYRIFTKKTYYISGTGLIKHTDKRMWFKTVFHTHGNVLPIKSLTKAIQKELGLESCVVVYFNKIPNSMAKYVEKDCDLEITCNPE